MKITKTLWLTALLCCAPATVVISGCGGGNSTLPAGSVPGSYTGTYGVVSGPDSGKSGSVTVTIDANGVVTGTATNPNDATITVPFTGTANASLRTFTLTGLFGDINGTGSGTIRNNSGLIRASGTFTLSNGDIGNITFAKVTPI
ncbi:hypothetical protein IAD21_01682 [Abditibacteriota bacterium]|nr:hypothetical protein IAD21_01682 [Abditibacteriota bacterium]